MNHIEQTLTELRSDRDALNVLIAGLEKYNGTQEPVAITQAPTESHGLYAQTIGRATRPILVNTDKAPRSTDAGAKAIEAALGLREPWGAPKLAEAVGEIEAGKPQS